MSEFVTIQIPSDWIEDLPKEKLILEEIFRMGLHEYKIQRSIQLYQRKVGTLGYISEKMDIPKEDLIRELRTRNLEPDFSELTLREELGE